jgi:hypothetical protein
LLLANAGDERFDVGFDGVIAADGDAFAAALRDFSGGFVNRAGEAFGAGLVAAAGDVDGGAGFAECEGDAFAETAGSAGDEDNITGEDCHN